MNEGFGKDFYRKGNSVKRSGPFTEPPDSENLKSCCPNPLPKNQLLQTSFVAKALGVGGSQLFCGGGKGTQTTKPTQTLQE